VNDPRFLPPPIREPAAPVVTEMPGATKSDATTIFLLGILGIMVCQLLAPYAWKKGNTYRDVCIIHGIEPDGLATAGRVLGMVGTVILALNLAMMLVWIAVMIAL
jgi:hypothetical protein